MIVKYIKTKDGKEMPIRFSQAVIIQLGDHEKIPMHKVATMMADFSSWPIGRFYRFIFLAFKDGARKDGVPFHLEYEDMIDLMEEDKTIIEQVLKVAKDSAPEKKTQARR